MACQHINTGGMVAIVCGLRGRRRCACGFESKYQCDWKMGNGKTCDRHLCGAHALEVDENKHLCVEHQKAYAEWKKRHENNQSR